MKLISQLLLLSLFITVIGCYQSMEQRRQIKKRIRIVKYGLQQFRAAKHDTAVGAYDYTP